MSCFTKLILLLVFIISPILAFDNEITIRGTIVEGISIDVLNLSESKEDIFLYTNSEAGARITVKTLDCSDKNRIKNILNNGDQYTLPMTYELFDSSSFLGTSPLNFDKIILGIDISVH